MEEARLLALLPIRRFDFSYFAFERSSVLAYDRSDSGDYFIRR
jgi:hypothetical protein